MAGYNEWIPNIGVGQVTFGTPIGEFVQRDCAMAGWPCPDLI